MAVIHLSAISKVCHSEPFAVILSEAKDRGILLRVNCAKNLGISYNQANTEILRRLRLIRMTVMPVF